jgi:Polyketide cyclase / dehydrase and lipid transport
MKALKMIGLLLGGIVALLLIIPAFTKKNYSVEKSVAIAKSRGEVFAYLKLLKNQDNFSVWAKMDPDMKKTYRGADGNVGFVSAWESKKDDVGTGEQEIKKIDEGNRIDYELRFIKPFEATSPAYLAFADAADGKTKVSWGMSGRMGYPMNLMLLFMNMEEMIGKDFDTGLANLKNILEKK